MIDLNEAKRIAKARTKGPWIGLFDQVQQSTSFDRPKIVCRFLGTTFEEINDDRSFIAWAGTNIDEILAELAAARNLYDSVADIALEHNDDCPQETDDCAPAYACNCGVYKVESSYRSYRSLQKGK